MKYSWLLLYSTIFFYYVFTSYLMTMQPTQRPPLAQIARLLMQKKESNILPQQASVQKPFLASSKKINQSVLDQQIINNMTQSVRSGSLSQVQTQLAAIPAIQFKQYIDSQDEEGNTLLHHASYLGYRDIAEFLILQDASVITKNNNGQTPLHRAQTAQMIALLIGYGASPHAIDHNGDTPLHTIAKNDNTPALEMLLNRDASSVAQNKLGNTPLMNAIIAKQASNARKLVSKLNWNIENLAGQSPASLMPATARLTQPTNGTAKRNQS